jgi:hypothetical protein
MITNKLRTDINTDIYYVLKSYSSDKYTLEVCNIVTERLIGMLAVYHGLGKIERHRVITSPSNNGDSYNIDIDIDGEKFPVVDNSKGD